MAELKRTELLARLEEGTFSCDGPVILFYGERYLCQQTADAAEHQLLAAQPGAVHHIDGDTEDPGQTLARLVSFSLLPGRQLYRVTDSRIFHSRTVAAEIWAKAVTAHQAGRPAQARSRLQAMVQAGGLEPDGPAPLSDLSGEEWQKLFGFAKPAENLAWADSLLAEARGTGRAAQAGLTDRYLAAFTKGLPDGNLLLLVAETVDKRQKLFSYIKKHGLVVDCSVATGAGAAAQTEQKEVLREMMQRTLAEFGKKIEPQAVELFFDRVGFHPVAVVTETEKLIHYVGDRPTIGLGDLEEMVVRNREDALYELTDAFAKRQTGKTLTILDRLLEQGTHALAILATMRNFLRRLLIFRALQLLPSPAWRQGMSARDFQNHYLPQLKAEGQWTDQLQGHPYALYMSFTKAAEYSCKGLERWLTMLLEAEFRLKGSVLPAKLVLEELFYAMLRGTPKVSR